MNLTHSHQWVYAKVDGKPIEAEGLWRPVMNFNQFRWKGTIGQYELQIPRDEFVRRLSNDYAKVVEDLQEDDRIVPDKDPSPLRDAEYAPLNIVLENPTARFELVRIYLYEEVFTAFLAQMPSGPTQFMINSVEAVDLQADQVVMRGRGYHGAPGFANE